MDIEKKFENDLKKFKSAPFLFIGSGFSRRYLGLESWQNLLKKFCLDDMKPFDYYLSKSESNLPDTASLMSEDFHEIWWESPNFEESRKEYSDFGKLPGVSSTLKYEISKYLKKKSVENIEKSLEKEVELFKNAVVDGIITTNWDMLLENFFPKYDVYIGQDDLLNSVVQEIAEIYKIHGSISNFNSIVLTEEDYKDFNNKNPYLAAKLLTIFIEHPIIFIGYSISDDNIKNILLSISKCISEAGLNKLEDNIFFIEPIFDETDDDYRDSFITINEQNLPITRIKVKNYSKVYAPLTKYERKISVKQLSRIKSQLYEIIKKNDPKGRIATIGLDQVDENEDIEFVIGMGVKDRFSKYGYLGIRYDDILEDIVLNNKDYNPEILINDALPEVLKKCYYTPYYKYLNKANYIDDQGNLIENVNERVEKYLDKSGKKFLTNNAKSIKRNNQSCNVYNYSIKPDRLIAQIFINGKESIDIVKLEKLLEKNVDILFNPENYDINKSSFRKMVRIYDWLKYC